MNDDKFYFKGVFFDNQEDFWKYVDIYNKSQISQESINHKFSSMARDFFVNLDMYKIKITNAEIEQIITSYYLELLGKIINGEKFQVARNVWIDEKENHVDK